MIVTEVIRFSLWAQRCPRFPTQIPFDPVVSLRLNLPPQHRCPDAGAESSCCLTSPIIAGASIVSELLPLARTQRSQRIVLGMLHVALVALRDTVGVLRMAFNKGRALW